MKKSYNLAIMLSSTLLLAACGSEDEATGENLARSVEVTSGDQTYNSVVGVDASETYAYFDLDTGRQLDLTEETAAQNTEWDVAFNALNIVVNGGFSGPGEIEATFTGNNSDFREGTSAEILAKFEAATPESELPDFLDVIEYAAETEFSTDEFSSVFGSDFYIYNGQDHSVSANEQQSYLVKSGDTYFKVRATSVSANGYSLGDITLGIQELTNIVVTTTGEGEEAETSVTFDLQDEQLVALSSCDGAGYVDLSLYQEVTSSDAWDLKVVCNAFEIHLGADVIAGDYANAENALAYADSEHVKYYIGADSSETVFKDMYKWYYYDYMSHNVYSQFGVYLVKTPEATYKFQLTGYYNLVGGEVKSRQISFIYAEVEEAAPALNE